MNSSNKYYQGQNDFIEDPYKLEREKLLKTGVMPKTGLSESLEVQDNILNSTKGLESESASLGDSLKGGGIGDKVMANAGGLLDFGTSLYSAATTTAGSDKEADMRALQLGVKGAGLGMSIGGPIGGVAGGIIGGAAGLLMKVPDRKKRLKEDYKNYDSKLFDEMNVRKGLAEDFNNQREVEKLMDLQKAQMGLVNLNY